MNEAHTLKYSLGRRFACWSVHAFTASGACMGIFSLYAIHQHDLLLALWLMSAAVVIDAVDGMFARMLKIKTVIPQIDGALLDNIVDFFNYTLVPCFFLMVTDMLPVEWRMLTVMAIIFSSAYQFTQIDAKTTDHFFKGFPSYWNIAVFYLFFWQLSSVTNTLILALLTILSFVPIKYVYPSRLDYLTDNEMLKAGMVVITLFWGIATIGLLWMYPESNPFLVAISVGYLLVYIGISLYRTWVPLPSLQMAAELE